MRRIRSIYRLPGDVLYWVTDRWTVEQVKEVIAKRRTTDESPTDEDVLLFMKDRVSSVMELNQTVFFHPDKTDTSSDKSLVLIGPDLLRMTSVTFYIAEE